MQSNSRRSAPIIFKKLGLAIVEPLKLIYSRSYEDGQIPDAFRLSIVTPVHKGKDKSNVNNYRPVAQGSIAPW